MERYRKWLKRSGVLVSDEFEQRLDNAFDAMNARMNELVAAVPISNASSWGVDLERKRIQWALKDGGAAEARIQIAGTFADQTWKWAWANSSIPDSLSVDAQRARERGEQLAMAPFTISEWPATRKDLLGIGALAWEFAGADGMFVGWGNSVDVVLLLYELRRSETSVEHEDPDPPGFFDEVSRMLGAQVPSLDEQFHREIQLVCHEAFECFERGDYAGAREHVRQAWESLPEYPHSYGPSGWLRGAMAEVELAAGDLDAAHEILLNDELYPPEWANRRWTDVMLARTYSARGDSTRAGRLALRSYLSNRDLLPELWPEGRPMLGAALEQAYRRSNKLLGIQPVDLESRVRHFVRTLLTDLHAFVADYAAQVWKEDEERGDRDRTKEESIRSSDRDLGWPVLLAGWFLPGCAVHLESYSEDPDHDPAKEEIVSVSSKDDGSFEVETLEREGQFGDSRWLYVVREHEGRLLCDGLYTGWEEDDGSVEWYRRI